MIDFLATHYGKQLKDEAEGIAADRGGHIVYLGLDGCLRTAMPHRSEATVERARSRAVRKLDESSAIEILMKNLSLFQAVPNDDTGSEEEFPRINVKERNIQNKKTH